LTKFLRLAEPTHPIVVGRRNKCPKGTSPINGLAAGTARGMQHVEIRDEQEALLAHP
jgi:hypothetical protein